MCTDRKHFGGFTIGSKKNTDSVELSYCEIVLRTSKEKKKTFNCCEIVLKSQIFSNLDWNNFSLQLE